MPQESSRFLESDKLLLLSLHQFDTEASFYSKIRLARALALEEETEVSPAEWLNAEARKRQALQEGGTLCHTLWRCLQSHVTPVLASVVEVLDRGANLDLLLVTNDESASRIQQFVSAFDNSRLGGHLQKLSEAEQVEYSQRFLHDFLLLSLKITTKAELAVFTKALWGCVSELQRSTGASPHLSPAWVMAAVKHYATRLHCLSHAMLLQEQLASEVCQLGAKRDPTEMVEDISALGICVERTKLLSVTSLEECKLFVRRVELLQPCLERAFSHNYSALCGPGCLQHLNSM
ncbi:hypothetical protein CRUP_004366, partial [Coryphaenoides rupestris]